MSTVQRVGEAVHLKLDQILESRCELLPRLSGYEVDQLGRAAISAMAEINLSEFVPSINEELKKNKDFSLTRLWYSVINAALKD